MENKDAIVACMQTMVTQMAYCVKEMEKICRNLDISLDYVEAKKEDC